jgi:hypothetical protein
MARESRAGIGTGGVYDVPFTAPQYREVRMVSDDGVLLVEIRVHERARRAQQTDMVPFLRAWRRLICEKEERESRGRLALLRPDAGDAKAS